MENQTELETDCHVYLYCFFKGPAALMPREGIDEKHDTFVITHNDICALVSSVSADEYSEDVLNERLQDLKWLPPKVKHHQDIINYAMGFHPVIPVRFGTIYENTERVLQILSNGYHELCSCLDFVSDKEEWGIKIYAEEGAGRNTIQASSATVAELDKQISSTSSSGRIYLLKKKREELVRQQSADVLRAMANDIYNKVLSWSIEGKKNALLSKNATGRECDMILNAAFLLSKSDVMAFREKVDDLAANYQDDALLFEISGPWLCYNFIPQFDM